MCGDGGGGGLVDRDGGSVLVAGDWTCLAAAAAVDRWMEMGGSVLVAVELTFRLVAAAAVGVVFSKLRMAVACEKDTLLCCTCKVSSPKDAATFTFRGARGFVSRAFFGLPAFRLIPSPDSPVIEISGMVMKCLL